MGGRTLPPCPAQVTLETWKLGSRVGVSLPRTRSRWRCSSARSWTSLLWTVAAQGSRPAPGLGSTAKPEAGDEELVRKWMLPGGERPEPRCPTWLPVMRDTASVCVRCPLWTEVSATRGWWRLYPTRPF